ncbi:hypothetical protein AYO41_04525 [Verrucomicrobia bacterium SCGC AG-212-E04]|nr:hypothetical protein AYO41_04525 [Verrucomicrobia bacterium SCGC AG-212-E04]
MAPIPWSSMEWLTFWILLANIATILVVSLYTFFTYRLFESQRAAIALTRAGLRAEALARRNMVRPLVILEADKPNAEGNPRLMPMRATCLRGEAHNYELRVLDNRQFESRQGRLLKEGQALDFAVIFDEGVTFEAVLIYTNIHGERLAQHFKWLPGIVHPYTLGEVEWNEPEIASEALLAAAHKLAPALARLEMHGN